VAAVVYPLSERPAAVRLRLVAVPCGRTARQSPARSRPGAGVYRRRRAVALLVLVLVLVLLLVAVAGGLVSRAALAGPGGGPLATTGSSGVGIMEPAVAHIHVVRPGETLWSIVGASGTRGDPRPAVDRLAAQLGGRPLQVGQRLVLP
jgi:hypothetical protein